MKLDISGDIQDYDGLVLKEGGTPLTIRLLLRMYAGSYIPEPGIKAGGESVVADAVGLKIHSCENGQIELTDEEYEILKKAIEPPRHGAMVYTRVYKCVFGEK
jgi:hypothetical protein